MAGSKIGSLYRHFVFDESIRGWKDLICADETLGYKIIPNSKGFQTFHADGDISLIHDSRGFRITDTAHTFCNTNAPVDILFLGCSFTYGYACQAEESFPYLVAKSKNLNYINAGVSAYSLSQMLILAQKLIPAYKPKYVVAQYSPWLSGRAARIYAPNKFGKIALPYFTYNGTQVKLEPPVFKNSILDVNKSGIREKYKNRFLSFCLRFGLPFYLKELFVGIKVKISTLFNPKNKPTSESALVENYAYNEIVRITTENGGQPLIVKISHEYEDRSFQKLDFKYKKVWVADADTLLAGHLHASPGQDYNRLFGHWKFNGVDWECVDTHPNPLAHKLISQSIIARLK